MSSRRCLAGSGVQGAKSVHESKDMDLSNVEEVYLRRWRSWSQWVAWSMHCDEAHPSPVWAAMRGADTTAASAAELAPASCERCQRLAPEEELIAWPHTRPAAAQQITSTGQLLGNPWAYFTAWPVEVTRSTRGVGAAGCGASVTCALPADTARRDRSFWGRGHEGLPMMHLRCDPQVSDRGRIKQELLDQWIGAGKPMG